MYPGATTQLKAEGTFSDGHTSDVTSLVSWMLTPPSEIATVGGGAFASMTPRDVFTRDRARWIWSLRARPPTVTVTLTGTVVGMGVTQGDLDGTPSGSGPTIAYPLDGALFPYQLGPIEFQVVPTSPSQ